MFTAKPVGQADTLKLCVIRPFQNAVIGERGEYVLRHFLAAGDVDHLHRSFIDGVSEQKHFKVG